MQRVGWLVGLALTAIAILTVPATARPDEEGTALTFRDEQGQLVHQHPHPAGCYNVPEPGWVIADLDRPAFLIGAHHCLGERITEIDRPTQVDAGQSVLVPY